MTNTFFNRVAMVLVSLFCVLSNPVPALHACSMPADPNVAILLGDQPPQDVAGKKGYEVDEDTEVTWVAYWDATEATSQLPAAAREFMGAPAVVVDGHPLYTLDTFQEVWRSCKFKVQEICERPPVNNSAWRSNPASPIELDGTVEGADLVASVTGGESWWCGGTPGGDPRSLPKIGSSKSAPASCGVTAPAELRIEGPGWVGNGGKWYLTGLECSWNLDAEPAVWMGGAATSGTGNTMSITYPTPTGNEALILATAELWVTYEYQNDGSSYQWDEVVYKDGSEVARRHFSATMTGGMSKSSTEDGGDTGLNELWVLVHDVSSPQHYSISPETISGSVGTPIDADFEVKVLENNPFAADMGTATATLVYSTMLCDWTHLDGEKKLCQEAPGLHPHPDYCDCLAYHGEHFVWKTIDMSQSSVEQVSIGGLPAYSVITFRPSGQMEPLPWHFAQGSHAYSFEGAQYTEFSPCQLKCFVVAADAEGHGVSSSPFGDGEENDVAKQTVSIGSPVSEVGCNFIPQPDKVHPPAGELIGRIGGRGSWGDWGTWAGVDDITDDQSPDIRVFITDTKYGWTHLFGHADALDGKVSQYQSARAGGTAAADSNDVSPYLGGPDCPETWTFDQEIDYLEQLEMIRAGGFCPIANIKEGTPLGLWVDEDTRLVFKIVCRDNINPWENENGLPFEVSLEDGPAGETLDGGALDISDDGVFEYIFRDPNRGENAVDRDCKLTVTVSDTNGNSRTMVINFFVASNDLRLQTLEEERRRKRDDY